MYLYNKIHATTYLGEQTFSKMKYIESNLRSTMSDK